MQIKNQKWHTPSDILVIRDAARHLADVWGNPDDDATIEYYYGLLQNDWWAGKIAPTRHGRNHAIKVDELERYYPESTGETEEALNQSDSIDFKQKVEVLLDFVEQGVVPKDTLVNALRKLLDE